MPGPLCLDQRIRFILCIRCRTFWHQSLLQSVRNSSRAGERYWPFGCFSVNQTASIWPQYNLAPSKTLRGISTLLNLRLSVVEQRDVTWPTSGQLPCNTPFDKMFSQWCCSFRRLSDPVSQYDILLPFTFQEHPPLHGSSPVAEEGQESCWSPYQIG